MAHPTSFRKWLAIRLAATKLRQPRKLTDEQFAKRLGVDVDLWREVKQKICVRVQRNPREPYWATEVRRRGTITKYLTIEMPRQICEAVRAYAKLQRLNPSVLIRSSAEYVLRQPRLKAEGNYSVASAWHFQGQDFVMPVVLGSGSRRERYRITGNVSLGAHQALALRADILKTSITALIRGALLDVLEGRITELPLVTIPRYMLDDMAKYVQFWEE